jgi:hypothetical protein
MNGIFAYSFSILLIFTYKCHIFLGDVPYDSIRFDLVFDNHVFINCLKA